MPHKCVSCGNVFKDGSDEIFDGCPDCDGSKFMFAKDVEDDKEEKPDKIEDKIKTETEEISPESERNTGEIIEAGPDEDRKDRFGGKFTISEVDGKEDKDPPADKTVNEDSANQDGTKSFEIPDTDELREELKDQFETIKIVEPGAYELNLMNLYEEDQKIIALEEDGKYQVSLPSALKENEPSQ
ncbi:MAG: Zn-ribbon containing protein [Halobacteria archaeon]